MSEARFSRQITLAEVGPAGQTRLAAATAHVTSGGLAGEVALRYAARAGFAQVSVDGARTTAPAWVTSAPAREMIEGSLSALAAFRDAVEVGP